MVGGGGNSLLSGLVGQGLSQDIRSLYFIDSHLLDVSFAAKS